MYKVLLFAFLTGVVSLDAQTPATSPAPAAKGPGEAAPASQGEPPLRDAGGAIKLPDGLARIQGSMVYLKAGKLLRVNQELKLSEGISARPDGTVTTKDGQQIRLEEGQMMGLDGKISMAPRGMGSTAPGASTALPTPNAGTLSDFGQSGTTGPGGKPANTEVAPASVK